jgi:hypothetical protein
VDHCIRVLGPAGRIILGRQPDRNRLLSVGGEFGDEPMPFPGVAAPTGDQGIRRQYSLSG